MACVYDWIGSQRRRITGSMVRQLRSINAYLAKTEAPPYLVEFSVDRRFDPTKIDLKQLRGLIYLQILAGDDANRLLLFWKNQESYAAIEPLVVSRVHLPEGSSPAWRGFHQDMRGPKPIPWTTLWAFVATAFVVLGYGEQVFDLYKQAFARPVTKVSPPQALVELAEGESLDVAFEVRNDSPLSTSSVTLEPTPQITPSSGLSGSSLTQAVFPAMKPADKVPFRTTIKADKAGEYELVVRGAAKSGFTSAPTQGSLRVKVWPPLEFTNRAVGNNDEKSCNVSMDLIVGRAHSKWSIRATLLDESGVSFDSLSYPHNPQGRPNNSDPSSDGARAWITWTSTLTPDDAKKTLKVIFFLKCTTNKSKLQWDAIADKIKIDIDTSSEVGAPP
jgi:hypothetical protein